jgi:hypothetical protein
VSTLLVTIHASVLALLHGSRSHRPRRGADRGQATAEYALVVVGAAAVAFIFISWAASGEGGERIGGLLNAVVDRVRDVVS